MTKGETHECELLCPPPSFYLFPLFLYTPRVAEDLKCCQSEAALLRHTLQCLIAGSGVDWAGDEALLQLTLSLGTQPQT